MASLITKRASRPVHSMARGVQSTSVRIVKTVAALLLHRWHYCASGTHLLLGGSAAVYPRIPSRRDI